MFEFLAKDFENFMTDLRSFGVNQNKIMKKYQSDTFAPMMTRSRNMINQSRKPSLADLKLGKKMELKVTEISDF